jgi:hypothetical protein
MSNEKHTNDSTEPVQGEKNLCRWVKASRELHPKHTEFLPLKVDGGFFIGYFGNDGKWRYEDNKLISGDIEYLEEAPSLSTGQTEVKKCSTHCDWPNCTLPECVDKSAVKKGERKLHELKTWPQYFQQVIDGVKTFEYRFNDRDFREGDDLLLLEYDPIKKTYSGRHCIVSVTSVLRSFKGIEDGYCIMSILLTHGASHPSSGKDQTAEGLQKSMWEEVEIESTDNKYYSGSDDHFRKGTFFEWMKSKYFLTLKPQPHAQ